jgi:excinuclease ABC subunit A
MQFMADIYLTCEVCNGKRFKQEVLEVVYKEKTISDVLDMTVDEALIFFGDRKPIFEKIQPLQQVGLGYAKLGQSSNSLSGGEAQRVKLASFLGKNSPEGHILFIFDEPTTGLHFHDISKLLTAINALVDDGKPRNVMPVRVNPVALSKSDCSSVRPVMKYASRLVL